MMPTQQLPAQSSGDALVAALVRVRAQALIWFARQLSTCVEDAEDATQNALVKLLVRMRDEPPTRVMSWLLTVLRHEAFAVHAARRRALADLPFDDAREGSAVVSDPATVIERRSAFAAAMRSLKPQERQALGLRAIGLSYTEICDVLSWTYTRCNRTVTEGRRALRDRLEATGTGPAGAPAIRLSRRPTCSASPERAGQRFAPLDAGSSGTVSQSPRGGAARQTTPGAPTCPAA